MTAAVHTLDQRTPRQSKIVNLTLSRIHTGNKESCLCIERIQGIKKGTGENVGAVIEGQGNGFGNSARIDLLTVWYCAKLRPGDICG